ncbi:MAG: FAD:protein FMN transferase, partial [Verrucomicrobiota bacterium]
GLQKVTRRHWALGAEVALTVYHDDVGAAEAALESALAELESVEAAMSLFRPTSDLARLNAAGTLEAPDPSLREVLEHALALSARTDGAFDPTVQPLWEVYANAHESDSLPDDAALAAAVGRVDWRAVQVRPDRITLGKPGMALTLNGIAQGYAADRVRQRLAASGIRHALLDTGEISTVGGRSDTDAWSIGIKHPRVPGDLLGLAALEGRSLATSGDYETRFSPDFLHHHLLDPRTGRCAGELASVSLAAPTAMEADALSTAVFVLGLERGRQLVAETAGADALFVTKDGDLFHTDGFPFRSEAGAVKRLSDHA